ncbi:hypothetical protein [Pseudomonas extremaustralis]|uniref:hypothetical protein n=1 Tax=Pseudomonas extremaustralis TaxID=359110 RepID=UPI0023078D56|nr:hypothetical protein [Pseudomonas extremaustralis]MDB1113565.1 hypothetical protein [Pseudomonas extremaustralis]
MARIRTIKPEFWTSEQVMECQPLARLLFIGIWNFCDDGGNHPLSEKTLKALVFPGDDITSATVRRLLDELSDSALISFYECSGKDYLHVNGWQHQKIDRPTIKHPPFHSAVPIENADKAGTYLSEDGKPGLSADLIDDNSTNDLGHVDEDSSRRSRALTPGRDREGIGKGEDQDQEQVVADAPAPAQAETPPGKKSKRGTRLPADWIAPDGWLAWAKGERSELDDRMLKAMADSFKDYWVSKSGANATKLDWEATWRNWVRNQRIGGAGQRAGPTKPSPHLNLDQIDHEAGLELQADGTYRIARNRT